MFCLFCMLPEIPPRWQGMLRAFSPRSLKRLLPDTVVFDIRGLRSIYGSPEQLAVEIRRRGGIEANLAIAGEPVMRRFMRRRGIWEGLHDFDSPRQAARYSLLLPLYLLGGSPEPRWHAALDMWGNSAPLESLPSFAGCAGGGGADWRDR